MYNQHVTELSGSWCRFFPTVNIPSSIVTGTLLNWRPPPGLQHGSLVPELPRHPPQSVTTIIFLRKQTCSVQWPSLASNKKRSTLLIEYKSKNKKIRFFTMHLVPMLPLLMEYDLLRHSSWSSGDSYSSLQTQFKRCLLWGVFPNYELLHPPSARKHPRGPLGPYGTDFCVKPNFPTRQRVLTNRAGSYSNLNSLNPGILYSVQYLSVIYHLSFHVTSMVDAVAHAFLNRKCSV